MLAQLQGANVGCNGPAVMGRDLGGVVGHGPETIGDNVKEMPDRGLTQALHVEGGRLAEPTLHNDPLALAITIMTGYTKNRVTLLPTLQERPRHWKRQGIDHLPIHHTCRE